MSNKNETVPFEEALDRTGFGMFNVRIFGVVALMIIAMAFETFSVAYLVPASACELKTDSATQGIMAAVPLVGILIASNIWGYLADTRGRRKILIISLVLGFIAGILAAFATNWIMFCFLKFLSSSVMAGTFGLALTFISECTPLAKRYTLVLLLGSTFLTSIGSMAALTIPVLPLKFSYYIPYLDIYFNSWRLLNIIYSVPSALGVLGAQFAMESPKFLLSVGRDKEALDVLRKIFSINTGKDFHEYKVDVVTLDEDSSTSNSKGLWQSIISQTVPLFKPPLLKHTLLISVLFIAVYFCVNPFLIWLPNMAHYFMASIERGEVGLTLCQILRAANNATVQEEVNDCALNTTAMTLVFTLNMLLAALNVLIAIVILPYVGRKRMFIAIQVVSGIAVMCINVSSYWVLTMILIITYVLAEINFGFLSTFSVAVFPTYVKAMGVCLTLMMGRGSAIIGINIMKNLLVNSCETTFYMIGSISLFGGLVGLLLVEDKRKRNSEDKEI